MLQSYLVTYAFCVKLSKSRVIFEPCKSTFGRIFSCSAVLLSLHKENTWWGSTSVLLKGKRTHIEVLLNFRCAWNDPSWIQAVLPFAVVPFYFERCHRSPLGHSSVPLALSCQLPWVFLLSLMRLWGNIPRFADCVGRSIHPLSLKWLRLPGVLALDPPPLSEVTLALLIMPNEIFEGLFWCCFVQPASMVHLPPHFIWLVKIMIRDGWLRENRWISRKKL